MSDSNNPTAERAARIAAIKENSQQQAIARQLLDSGLITNTDSIEFISQAQVQAIMDRARDSGLQTGWQRRSSLDEIIPEVSAWLEGRDHVVSGLTCIKAPGSWFANRVTELQVLWRDLYFYAHDGLSGYLVNYDRERGFETLSW